MYIHSTYRKVGIWPIWPRKNEAMDGSCVGHLKYRSQPARRGEETLIPLQFGRRVMIVSLVWDANRSCPFDIACRMSAV